MAASVSRACLNLSRKSVKLGIFNLSRDFQIARPAAFYYADNVRLYSSKNETKEELPEFEFDEEDESAEYERELEKKRNKSRLRDNHFRAMHGQQPYEEPVAWFHHSIKYKKRMFGRYGIEGSDIPLGALWPNKEDLADQKAYEECLRPLSLQTMMSNVRNEKIQAEEATKKRQEDMALKFDKLDQWKKELNARLDKKRKEAEASKAKREKLIEDVRRMVGFNVDPKDEKFKMVLEQKEKEQKKKDKEEKKSLKAAKLIDSMKAKAKNTDANTPSQS